MTRVLKRRLAGDNHAVITVSGGGHHFRREVCARCPWRLDAVGEFPAEAFRHSANTGTDGAQATAASIDTAMHTFGCHDSGSEKPATCAGYIMRGSGAIGWRIAVVLGRFNPAQARETVPLFDNYYEMAIANGVSSDDPALDACRPCKGHHE